MKTLRLAFLILLASFSVLKGQQLDNTFHSPVPVRAGYIASMVTQPDGRILLAGEIAYYRSKAVTNLIRIVPDGTLDAGFDANLPSDFVVEDMQLMQTGDIALFLRSTSPVSPHSKIVILSSAGALKRESITFEDARAFAVLPDGQALIGGNSSGLRRLHSDLSIDPAFAVSSNGTITDIEVQGDKIFLSGTFDKINGSVKNDIVKLNLDGTIDHTFDTGTGTSDYVGSITVSHDGKVLPGTTYINSFNGMPAGGSIRLNSDGSRDASFNPPWDFHGPINKVVIGGDGLYIASHFDIGGVSGNHLVRFNEDGSRDHSFTPVAFKFDVVYDIHVVTSGDGVIFSGPSKFGNVYGLTAADQNGNIQADFNPKISRVGILRSGERVGDKLIVAGDFVKIDSLETFGLARLQLDGSVDPSFVLKENFGSVYQMRQVDNGNTLVTTYSNLFKVDDSGEIVDGFQWQPRPPLYQVIKFDLLPDGKIIAVDPNTLVRLHSDGSYDESFSVERGDGSSTAFDFDFQGENIIYGYFGIRDEQHGEVEAVVRRVKTDGSFDPTFSKAGPDVTPESLWTSVSLVKVLESGDILVGGSFKEYGGYKVAHGLVKLSADGVLDETFNENQRISSGPEAYFEGSAEEMGGKIYIKTKFYIHAINPDGTTDSFVLPMGVDAVSDIVTIPSDAEPSGRMAGDEDQLIAIGSFYDAESKSQGSMVKLKLTPSTTPTDPGGVTSINGDRGAIQVDVFPNPTSGRLTVKANDSAEIHISVYSPTGLKIIDLPGGSTDDGGNVLDVSQVPPGVYTIKVVTGTGRTAISKFVRMP